MTHCVIKVCRSAVASLCSALSHIQFSLGARRGTEAAAYATKSLIEYPGAIRRVIGKLNLGNIFLFVRRDNLCSDNNVLYTVLSCLPYWNIDLF